MAETKPGNQAEKANKNEKVGHVVANKIYSECNYLQGNEGNIDLLHTSFLHYIRRDLSALTPEQRKLKVPAGIDGYTGSGAHAGSTWSK